MHISGRSLLPLAVSAVVAIGCSSLGASPSPSLAPTESPGPTASPAPTPSAVPSATPAPSPTSSPSPVPSPSSTPAADQLVVKIELVGGFVGPATLIGRYPTLALYGDGRLITQGAVDMIYPGPALPSLLVTQLTPAGVVQVLEWATEAGLAGPDRTLGEPVPDLPAEVFTVVRGTSVHTTSVLGLSSTDPDIAAAHDFESRLLAVRNNLPNDVVGPDQPYEWDRLQIMATPTTPDDLPDPQLVTIVDWPLAPLATIGAAWPLGSDSRCALVEGADLATLRPLLDTANQATLWKSDGQTYAVVLHPLLPDGVACQLPA
jgi:hypothetical protein